MRVTEKCLDIWDAEAVRHFRRKLCYGMTFGLYMTLHMWIEISPRELEAEMSKCRSSSLRDVNPSRSQTDINRNHTCELKKRENERLHCRRGSGPTRYFVCEHGKSATIRPTIVTVHDNCTADSENLAFLAPQRVENSINTQKPRNCQLARTR